MVKIYKATQKLAIFDLNCLDTSDVGGILISENFFNESVVIDKDEVFTIEETDEDEFVLDDGTVFGDETSVSNSIQNGLIVLQDPSKLK